MKNILLVMLFIFTIIGCKTENKNEGDIVDESQDVAINSEEKNIKQAFNLTPIEHATAVFTWGETVFYIDPVGGADAFEGQPVPDVILITDIHGDHLNNETVNAVITTQTKIYAPSAVIDKMAGTAKGQTKVIENGETKEVAGIKVKAIPMYNLREEAKQFHTKGRGNGYVLSTKDLKVYFSGDTEDIPEMRNLEGIDKAYVCMNLPYTMPVNKAAEAVLAFKPKEVYPYHFRGKNGMSDVGKFKSIVNENNKDIQVKILDWYPNSKE